MSPSRHPGVSDLRSRIEVARAPIRGEVRRALLAALLHGDPAPGSSLNEPALATELGISRTPLREALLELQTQGFVSSTPGRGFFVAPLTRREVEEIYPMPWTFEGFALRTAPVPTVNVLDELEGINQRLAGAQRDPEAALGADRRWHAKLLHDCGNALLLETISALKNRAFRYEFAYMRSSGRVITSVTQHRDIVQALRQDDRDTAVARLESNWRVSVDFLVPWLVAERTQPGSGPARERPHE